MPAAYAHYRFGQDCLDRLPVRLQEVCRKYEDLYNIGVHGPDIFFYYYPLTKNKVNGFGSAMHQKAGRDFFMKALRSYRQNSRKEAHMAYMLGFLAHFTLDSCAHAYINDRAAEGPFSHNYIESQYEAFLMYRDGLDPVKVDRSDYVKPDDFTAEIIAGFFDFPVKTVKKTTKGQRSTLHLLYSPLGLKKKALRKLIGLLHMGGSFGDLFLDAGEDPGCAEMNRKIGEDQQRALDLYPVLARNLLQCLHGREELNEYFDYNFEGIRVQKAYK